MEWLETVKSIKTGDPLTYDHAHALMDSIMSGELGDARLAAFLTALALRSPTATEVHGLADAMREYAVKIDLPSHSLDIVGTGGDGAHTVNISTMAALVAAGAGIPLVKHGNRAATSASGSADVLEAAGIQISLDLYRIKEIMDEIHIAFLFANIFHPSMRFVSAVRRQLSFPTVFNILGPLTNPVQPIASAIGANNFSSAELIAGVLAARGSSAFVFSGLKRGLDELTTVEPSLVRIVLDGKIKTEKFDAVTDLGMEPAQLEDLRGDDPAYNADVLHRILNGEKGPIRDAVLLNAGAGIAAFENSVKTSGKQMGSVRDMIAAGVERAAASIDSGNALNIFDSWARASHE